MCLVLLLCVCVCLSMVLCAYGFVVAGSGGGRCCACCHCCGAPPLAEQCTRGFIMLGVVAVYWDVVFDVVFGVCVVCRCCSLLV